MTDVTAAATPALQVSGVDKFFGGLRALSDVSFSVGPSEIVGLIGPNGAGKSTLFEVISGGLAPTRGQIKMFDQDITRLPAHDRRRAGLCRTFQKIRLFGSLTVRQNVAVAARECSVPGQDWSEDVASLLQTVRLTAAADRLPSELTLADRKRLEIARAMAGHCRILMLDESLSGLTLDEARELAAEIAELNHTRGVTIIVVEHVIPVVAQLARRLVVLQNGAIIADGTPSSIANDPRVVEAYLGKRWSDMSWQS